MEAIAIRLEAVGGHRFRLEAIASSNKLDKAPLAMALRVPLLPPRGVWRRPARGEALAALRGALVCGVAGPGLPPVRSDDGGAWKRTERGPGGWGSLVVGLCMFIYG